MPIHQRAFYWLCWWISLLTVTVLFRYRRFGRRNAPREGAFLIVANHESYLDPVLVGCAIDHQPVTPLARRSLFDNIFFGTLIRLLGSVPIDETGGDVAAIKEGVRQLRAGRIVSLYPEGGRSHDGTIQPFKRGALLLIKRSTVPILPVAVAGAYNAWPRSKRFPRIFGPRVAVNVGEPIAHEDLLKDGDDAALRRLEQIIAGLKAEIAPIVGA
ncbi:MAG: 1-acyl-sn-glycerol-3-phosphate acyltransferase [Phycisphaeraceae bacterium]|nr:1-acyl-sn-glycerol-3-phosphate acyltransferase [Phycisphaeraceae bacterium]